MSYKVTTYSFLDINATLVGVGGTVNVGSGSMVAEEGIEIEAVEDKSTMRIGADGSTVHSLHASTACTVRINLLAESETNEQLNRMYKLQTVSSKTHGKNVLTINNTASNEMIVLSNGAFKKTPKKSFKKDAEIVTWEFDFGSMVG